MLRGNKLVLILPLILTIIMFISGYHFLQHTETITNEELKDYIQYDVNFSETNDQIHIYVNWDWKMMPSEGLYGDDYIGIALKDGTDAIFTDSILKLIYANEVVKEMKGTAVENGLIFEFPTKMIEHASLGNLGEVTTTVRGENIRSHMIDIYLLHTWTDHSPLDMVDATFSNPTFGEAKNVPYWVMSFN